MLLQGFYQQYLLSFDYHSGVWQWEMESIARTDVPADAADMLCAHMHHLAQELQDILQYAAMLGSHFSLHKLHIIMQLPVSELAAGVCALTASSMLVCTAGSNVLHLLRDSSAEDAATTPEPSSSSASDAPDSVRLAECRMAFAHDKIQSAALKLIPPQQLATMHLLIASAHSAHALPTQPRAAVWLVHARIMSTDPECVCLSLCDCPVTVCPRRSPPLSWMSARAKSCIICRTGAPVRRVSSRLSSASAVIVCVGWCAWPLSPATSRAGRPMRKRRATV